MVLDSCTDFSASIRLGAQKLAANKAAKQEEWEEKTKLGMSM
jgi:hypothetical protein